MSDRQLIDSPRAWLTVVATFFSSAVALGTVYCFGAFFQSMADDFGSGKGSTAVIFGLTTFSFFWLSLITSRLADRYGPRPVLAAGAVALFVGLWATSNVNSIGIGYITFGAGAGIGAACAYIPMVAHVGGWFEKSRATAVGISVAGIGVGTLVMNPLAARLIDLYGWRSTYRIFAVVGFLVLLAGTLMMARAPGEAGAAPSRIREAFASSTFRKLWLAALCYAIALFIPFVFAVPYAKERGISPVAAATLVGLLGGSSVLSRIGFSWLTNHFGTFRIFRFGFVLCPIAFAIWLLAGSSFVALAIFMVIMGIGYGSFVAVSPLVLADLFGVVGLGSLMGIMYTACGLGALIGPPIAGRMIDVQGSYTMPLLVGLGLGLISLLLLTLLRTTPSGNIAVPGAQSDVIPGPGNEIALAITAFDETLMELEDWLEP
ncbi:MAG: MFS transporter [Actinomycetota bacterium]|nr:MFS transporter [Actinomycetota bacterium]MED5361630.1 MFS transporter [Actinomycetota bacterium]MEE3257085.1 MFS transporter [Actinomycetota bacterium]